MYRDYVVTGAKTRIRELVVVWVPEGVTARAELSKLPVVMNLSGAYGAPSGYLRASDFGQQATALIKARRIRPFIGVIPMVNVKLPYDRHRVRRLPRRCPGLHVASIRRSSLGTQGSGCFSGPLSVDRRGRFHRRILRGKLQAGASTAFSAGASVLGYFLPEPDTTTLNLEHLLQVDPVLRQQNDVEWLARNQTPPGQLRLLVVSSRNDPQSWPQYQAFKTRVPSLSGLTYLEVPGLPHTDQSMGDVQKYTLPYLLGPPA